MTEVRFTTKVKQQFVFAISRKQEVLLTNETSPVTGDKAGGPSWRMAVDAVKWRIQPEARVLSHWPNSSDALALLLLRMKSVSDAK